MLSRSPDRPAYNEVGQDIRPPSPAELQWLEDFHPGLVGVERAVSVCLLPGQLPPAPPVEPQQEAA